MSNMSYCRFENTSSDIDDCLEHIHDDDLSEREERAREWVIETCRKIVEEVDND